MKEDCLEREPASIVGLISLLPFQSDVVIIVIVENFITFDIYSSSCEKYFSFITEIF
jgi:hypothetical protein